MPALSPSASFPTHALPASTTVCACSMCVRIGALPGLRSVFRDYIRATGSAVVLDEVKVGDRKGGL